jgi:hypothetical protein
MLCGLCGRVAQRFGYRLLPCALPTALFSMSINFTAIFGHGREKVKLFLMPVNWLVAMV